VTSEQDESSLGGVGLMKDGDEGSWSSHGQRAYINRWPSARTSPP
jgi:hypothetical protein